MLFTFSIDSIILPYKFQAHLKHFRCILDKQNKGELKRQSPVSDGETAIKVHGGNQTFKPYQSESKKLHQEI